MRPEGIGELKKSMTTSGLEPVIVRLVVCSLNFARYRVPEIESAVQHCFKYVILNRI
jgi:hypothetical protein